tara:strand:- start:345 stop:464 length:120 start_codon:yes stop_codon:yes gene_type:complete
VVNGFDHASNGSVIGWMAIQIKITSDAAHTFPFSLMAQN